MKSVQTAFNTTGGAIRLTDSPLCSLIQSIPSPNKRVAKTTTLTARQLLFETYCLGLTHPQPGNGPFAVRVTRIAAIKLGGLPHMYLEVRHVVLTIKCPHLDLDRINQMLHVALEYDFCDVSLALDKDWTRLGLHFKQVRTSVFVEQWVLFWMRPFRVDYSLDFDNPENGKDLAVSCGVVV